MIEVEQTNISPNKGNCLAACLASILEINLQDVPDMTGQKLTSQLKILNRWLVENFGMYVFLVDAALKWKPYGYHLIGGNSATFGGDAGHVVVGYSGRMVFDPNPNKKGLGSILEYWVFVQADPGDARRRNHCRMGHYKSNVSVKHGALICHGGHGQPPCKWLYTCAEERGIKLRKSGR